MKKYSYPTQKEVDFINSFVLKKKKKNAKQLQKDALVWMNSAWQNKMDYEVSWFGIPIIQNPYDMIVMQELLFNLKPDVILETGIAHGGSLLYYSSLLELLGKGKVIGIDIDIRSHNRKLLEKHPFIKRVTMIEGNSVSAEVLNQVKKQIRKNDKVLVILDSDHSKKHVAKELIAYAPLVSKGSYLIVFDTFMKDIVPLNPSAVNNRTMEAVNEFLKTNKNFVIDKMFNKFYVSSSPDGFLKRVK